MKKGLRKFLSRTTAVGLILAALGVATLPILSQAHIIGQLLGSTVRSYFINFYQFKGKECIYSTGYVKRGESFNYEGLIEPEYPVQKEDGVYKFLGWDITGDGVADILPTKAYSSATAYAVYFIYEVEEDEEDALTKYKAEVVNNE